MAACCGAKLSTVTDDLCLWVLQYTFADISNGGGRGVPLRLCAGAHGLGNLDNQPPFTVSIAKGGISAFPPTN